MTGIPQRRDGPGIRDHGDGRVTLGGIMPALCRAVDRRLRVAASREGARELRCPALIERAVLHRAGYFEAFPHGPTEIRDCEYSLQPAACYQCYAELAGTCVDRTVLTVCGRCYRRSEDTFAGATRLWEFTMREVVLLGAADWIRAERAAWIDRVSDIAREIDLEVSVSVATDPFFGPSGRGRRVLQQLKELKHEIRAVIDGEDVALASVNLHETFFANRFDLQDAAGERAHTACVAFGLERWAAAIVAQRGEAAAAALAGGDL
jgi:seryl-tRNA synthetase